jgi:poly(3-hydroxybutyrate) depolymerase
MLLLGPVAAAPAAARTPSAPAATRGALSPAAVPPFAEPETWADLCTARRPAGTPLVRGTTCRWVDVDGVWRRYVVYLPPSDRWPMTRTWPLVVMFHGSGQTGEHAWGTARWQQVADEQGVVVAFPTAWRYQRRAGRIKHRWNTYALDREIKLDVRVDGYPEDAPYPARDIVFVRRLVDDLRGVIRVDPRRIFATGQSNGGKFVQRVAVRMGSSIAAVSCMGYCDAPPSGVRRKRKVPVLFGLGTRDRLVLENLNQDLKPDLERIPLAWEQAAPLLDHLLPALRERSHDAEGEPGARRFRYAVRRIVGKESPLPCVSPRASPARSSCCRSCLRCCWSRRGRWPARHRRSRHPRRGARCAT